MIWPVSTLPAPCPSISHFCQWALTPPSCGSSYTHWHHLLLLLRELRHAHLWAGCFPGNLRLNWLPVHGFAHLGCAPCLYIPLYSHFYYLFLLLQVFHSVSSIFTIAKLHLIDTSSNVIIKCLLNKWMRLDGSGNSLFSFFWNTYSCVTLTPKN